MTLTVETGSGLATADSYASLADATAYATAYGLPWVGDDQAKEAALRRATAHVDSSYRARFPGYRKFRRLQALEWPRVNAFVREPEANEPYNIAPGYYGADVLTDIGQILPNDAVPVEVVRATVAVASRDMARVRFALSGESSSGEIKREKAADHEVEYFQSTSATLAVAAEEAALAIDAILRGILIARSGYTARAARA